MKIVADIEMAYNEEFGANLFERLVYDSATRSATSEILILETGEIVRPVRRGFGLSNIECCRFLDVLGHDQQAGRLMNVEIIGE